MSNDTIIVDIANRTYTVNKTEEKEEKEFSVQFNKNDYKFNIPEPITSEGFTDNTIIAHYDSKQYTFSYKNGIYILNNNNQNNNNQNTNKYYTISKEPIVVKEYDDENKAIAAYALASKSDSSHNTNTNGGKRLKLRTRRNKCKPKGLLRVSRKKK